MKRKMSIAQSRTQLITLLIFCFALNITFASDSLAPSAVFVHPDAAGKLPIIGSVAVVLTGVDRQTNRLLEDALTMLVLSESIKVIYPIEKDLGKERQVPTEPIEFARKIGANCLITGNVIARCGQCSRGKVRCTNEEIRALSLSLVDVPQDKVLLWALYEPEDYSPVAICRSFVNFMIASLKEPEEEKQKEKK
ncbi:MAG: hypothetical protein ABIK23_08015 [candidate division WOR-3 bacterium]